MTRSWTSPRAGPPQIVDHRQAILSWQGEINQDNIRRLPEEVFVKHLGTRRRPDRVTLLRQKADDELAQNGIVINDGQSGLSGHGKSITRDWWYGYGVVGNLPTTV